MKNLLVLLLSMVLFACQTPGVPSKAEQQELVDLCAQFLDHYCQGRFAEVEELLAPEAVVAIDRVDKNQQSLLSAKAFMAKTRASWDQGVRFREYLVGEPIILRDNNLACVWAPYRIEAEDFQAEGIDIFQWLKIEGVWRLISLSYTNRPL